MKSVGCIKTEHYGSTIRIHAAPKVNTVVTSAHNLNGPPNADNRCKSYASFPRRSDGATKIITRKQNSNLKRDKPTKTVP